MSLCTWTEVDGKLTCPTCGHPAPVQNPRHMRNCRTDRPALEEAAKVSSQKPCPNCPGSLHYLIRLGWNFAAAVAYWAASGCKLVTKATYDARRAICEGDPSSEDFNKRLPCKQHQGGRCQACGCWILAKAAAASEDCPLKKWPAG